VLQEFQGVSEHFFLSFHPYLGKEINPKLKQVIIKQMGTEEQEVPEDKRLRPCLSDEEALKILNRLGLDNSPNAKIFLEKIFKK
jgi:hypothetical protein